MIPNKSLIEVHEYNGEGYKPLMAFDAWRVAVLNGTPELLPVNLNKMSWLETCAFQAKSGPGDGLEKAHYQLER